MRPRVPLSRDLPLFLFRRGSGCLPWLSSPSSSRLTLPGSEVLSSRLLLGAAAEALGAIVRHSSPLLILPGAPVSSFLATFSGEGALRSASLSPGSPSRDLPSSSLTSVSAVRQASSSELSSVYSLSSALSLPAEDAIPGPEVRPFDPFSGGTEVPAFPLGWLSSRGQ